MCFIKKYVWSPQKWYVFDISLEKKIKKSVCPNKACLPEKFKKVTSEEKKHCGCF